MENQQKYLVTIRCITYNHEKYLADALEGFVMQKTNFPFVAIVHDDASTDGTAAILRQYAEKYPDIIHPIYETENQYSKHDGSLGRIMDAAVDATGAKYVAMCEGDDYWTDPYKLQKQVDFLESHPDYSMCCHGADVINETNRPIDSLCQVMATREYVFEDAFPKWQIPTASIVYNKSMKDSYPILKHGECLVAGDVTLILTCMHVGRVWGMAEHMSVYRMNPGGATSVARTPERDEKYIKHLKVLKNNFPKINKQWIDRRIAMHYYSKMRNDYGLTRIGYLVRAFIYSPAYVFAKFIIALTHTNNPKLNSIVCLNYV